jgi:hypothetical protein
MPLAALKLVLTPVWMMGSLKKAGKPRKPRKGEKKSGHVTANVSLLLEIPIFLVAVL